MAAGLNTYKVHRGTAGVATVERVWQVTLDEHWVRLLDEDNRVAAAYPAKTVSAIEVVRES